MHFPNVEEGQGGISRTVETTGNLSSVCALVSQADFVLSPVWEPVRFESVART